MRAPPFLGGGGGASGHACHRRRGGVGGKAVRHCYRDRCRCQCHDVPLVGVFRSPTLDLPVMTPEMRRRKDWVTLSIVAFRYTRTSNVGSSLRDNALYELPRDRICALTTLNGIATANSNLSVADAGALAVGTGATTLYGGRGWDLPFAWWPSLV